MNTTTTSMRSKKQPAPAKPAEPYTVERVLDTIAGHVLNLGTGVRGCGICGGYDDARGCILEGAPEVFVSIERTSTGCFVLNGKHVGNEYGAARELMQLYAPVVSWCAAYWAGKETAQ